MAVSVGLSTNGLNDSVRVLDVYRALIENPNLIYTATLSDEPDAYYPWELYRRKNLDPLDIHNYVALGYYAFQNQFLFLKSNNNRLLLFPNALNIEEGDEILVTDSYYDKSKVLDVLVVDQVIKNKLGLFTGRVVVNRKDGGGEPDIDNDSCLLLPERRLVKMEYGFPAGEIHDQRATKEDPEARSKLYPPVITFRMFRKEVASHLGKPFSGRGRSYDYRLYDSFDDPRDVSYSIDVFAQFWDVMVQYNGWTQSEILSERLIDLFEDFMSTFTPVIRYFGVDVVLHAGRTADRFVKYSRPDMKSVSVNYMFRCHTLTYTRSRKISAVEINTRVEQE